MEILNVKISPEAVDKDDIEILEDLIRAAFNDAMIKLKQKMREEFSFLSNNMNIPPGLMGM
jgi:DNA-binding protein YbaB